MSTPQHEALRKFSSQIDFTIKNYVPHSLKAAQFSNILIGGLGGSGIGGRITKALFADTCPVPVECTAEYNLPAYVNENTLVILASYSGNTEETLQMFEETKARGSKILILTSGGKLSQLAKENNLYSLPIEAGFQPRMALGFSLTYLIQIFAELTGKDVKAELTELVNIFADTKTFEDDAAQIFEAAKSKAKSKFVVITDAALEPVGIRFAQQIQENAKHECFQHTLPEMNHNVIESYYGKLDSFFIFLNAQKNQRVTSRFEFLQNLLEVQNNTALELEVPDYSLRSVYETIYVLDWLSLFIADFRRVDSLNVPNIASLKEFLENV